MMIRLITVLLATVLTATAASAANIHYTRYLGFITANGVDHKLAVTMDLFPVQSDDVTAFPKLAANVRIGLGGPQSSEYETAVYEDVRYDFENGILTLDSPENDVVITVKASGADQTIFDGQILVRSSAKLGTIHLVEVSDDPEAVSGALPGDQYKPLVSGQYTGTCSGSRAILQVETARGLKGAGANHLGLADYTIVGRLGLHDDDASCPAPLFCAMRNYTSGTFDVFQNRLLLDAGTTDACQVTGTGATCTVHYGMDTLQCALTREPTPVPPPTYYDARYSLRPTAAQMAKLPLPDPPSNSDLIAALGGEYLGYLHNESSDHYQVLRLEAMAFSSTNNPHNENLVYVNGAAALHFGDTISGDFWVQQFEPRSFYLTDGFTLLSPNSDAYIQVKDWRMGYIRGVWYSQAFGRVGAFELIKGEQLPPLSGPAKFVPSVTGRYVGPHGLGGEGDDAWTFGLTVPTQQPHAGVSTLAFQGDYELLNGAIPRRSIPVGAYDIYSGALAWMSGEGRVVTGKIGDGGVANLFWPGAPIWDVIMETDHGLYPYSQH